MSEFSDLSAQVLAACHARRLMVATAESCTGGMIAAALTDIAGSSEVFDRGFVTYSNEAKTQMLGVKGETLERHGAVSAQTAQDMAECALARSHAAIAVAVTGVAGPGGGTDTKPVGLVWFGLAMRERAPLTVERRFGDPGRGAIRAAATRQALELILEAAETGGERQPAASARP